MAKPLSVALLLLAAQINSLPISNRNGTSSNNLVIRGEAKSDEEGLSDEAIIGIAAIFVPIVISILTLTLPAPRKRILRCFTGRTPQKPIKQQQRVHRCWPRSRY
ncbi:hypothetical protein OPT61_g2649 [Boeremia exigua]|uniref:Uncharacterized protein n=1 Tax=Boeremia exigua TaxID=749465 RepID=A0ACC2IKV1_9PLEO|nr:hypothetical protein OPT61_g2649 [Boeremia exigua]